MNWEEFSRATGFEEGKGTWATASLLWLKSNKFKVIQFDIFDYQDFGNSGGDYLMRKSGKKVGEWQIAHSNIPVEQQRAKELIKSGIWEKCVPTVEDIKNYLNDGYLITCLVNAAKLNGGQGYVGHAVVVKGFDDMNLFLHDPGLPPMPDRKVSYEDFEKAWADPYPDSKEMNIMKLNTWLVKYFPYSRPCPLTPVL